MNLVSESPDGLPPLLQALWWDAKGDWEKGHDLAAAESTRAAARVHAYLHRKEGDHGNAGYWYATAGDTPFIGSLDQEWRDLVRQLGG